MTDTTQLEPARDSTAQVVGVAPYMMLSDAAGAANFYAKAFAAEELARMPPDPKGRYMHIHLRINGGSVMLCDAFPEHGAALEPQQGYTLHLQVDDADAWHQRAVGAGAESMLAPHDAFWGDRYAQLRDPYGVRWSLGSPLKG